MHEQDNKVLHDLIEDLAIYIEKPYGFNASALLHGSLHVWRRSLDQTPINESLEDLFFNESIENLVNILEITYDDAANLVEDFLTTKHLSIKG